MNLQQCRHINRSLGDSMQMMHMNVSSSSVDTFRLDILVGMKRRQRKQSNAISRDKNLISFVVTRQSNYPEVSAWVICCFQRRGISVLLDRRKTRLMVRSGSQFPVGVSETLRATVRLPINEGHTSSLANESNVCLIIYIIQCAYVIDIIGDWSQTAYI